MAKLPNVISDLSILIKDSIFIKWPFMTNLPSNQGSTLYTLARKIVFIHELFELGKNKILKVTSWIISILIVKWYLDL